MVYLIFGMSIQIPTKAGSENSSHPVCVSVYILYPLLLLRSTSSVICNSWLLAFSSGTSENMRGVAAATAAAVDDNIGKRIKICRKERPDDAYFSSSLSKYCTVSLLIQKNCPIEGGKLIKRWYANKCGVCAGTTYLFAFVIWYLIHTKVQNNLN